MEWIKASERKPPINVKVIIRDDDGIAYTDSAINGWDERINDYEWLDESPSPPEQVGKEAIEFGEYLLNNHHARFKDSDDENKTRFWVSDEFVWGSKVPDNKCLTTAELYKLFNPKWAEQAKQEAPGDEKIDLVPALEWALSTLDYHNERKLGQDESISAQVEFAREQLVKYKSVTPTPVLQSIEIKIHETLEKVVKYFDSADNHGQQRDTIEDVKDILATLPAKDKDEFLNYVDEARDEFVRVITKYFPHEVPVAGQNEYSRQLRSDIRVSSENILIAYDQMRERILDKTNEAGERK